MKARNSGKINSSHCISIGFYVSTYRLCTAVYLKKQHTKISRVLDTIKIFVDRYPKRCILDLLSKLKT